MPDAREHAPATSCFPARCWRPPTTPHTSPGPLALSLALPPPLDLSLSSHPSELVAADRCCRGHRLRLVPLTCLRALRRRPRLLHRPRQAGTHRSVLIALVFGLGRRGSPPSNSRQPTLPRARFDALCDRCELHRRLPLFPLLLDHRSRRFDRSRSTSPPAMAPPWPGAEPAATEHVTVLLVPRGCRRAPRVASPCPAARSRSKPNSGRRPELRSGELRPSPPLPLAPDDADERWLLASGLRRPNGRRRAKSEALRRVWLAGVKPPVALTPLTVDWVGPV